jgi:hypothetical protein
MIARRDQGRVKAREAVVMMKVTTAMTVDMVGLAMKSWSTG